MSERTIEATPQRRRQARLEGKFPRSRELTISAMGLMALAVLVCRGSAWFAAGGHLLKSQLSAAPNLVMDAQHLESLTVEPLANTCAALFPLLAVGLVTMLIIQLMQGGWVWLPDRALADVSRIGPANWHRLLSVDRTIRALFALLKTLIGLAVLLGGIWFYRERFVGAQQETLLAGLIAIAMPVTNVALVVILAIALMSMAEYAVRLSSYYRSLRMTAQELRDENRGRTAMRVASSVPAGDGGPQRREMR
jgi:flagellar biosynthesis protein FlhB